MKFHGYLFLAHESGNCFFVKCKDFDEALDILYNNGIMWADVDFLGTYSSAEAELLDYRKQPTAQEIEDFWNEK